MHSSLILALLNVGGAVAAALGQPVDPTEIFESNGVFCQKMRPRRLTPPKCKPAKQQETSNVDRAYGDQCAEMVVKGVRDNYGLNCWHWDDDVYARIATSSKEGCTLYMRKKNEEVLEDQTVQLTTQDISDFFRTAVNGFSNPDGFVASEGTTQCLTTTGEWADMEFKIASALRWDE